MISNLAAGRASGILVPGRGLEGKTVGVEGEIGEDEGGAGLLATVEEGIEVTGVDTGVDAAADTGLAVGTVGGGVETGVVGVVNTGLAAGAEAVVLIWGVAVVTGLGVWGTWEVVKGGEATEGEEGLGVIGVVCWDSTTGGGVEGEAVEVTTGVGLEDEGVVAETEGGVEAAETTGVGLIVGGTDVDEGVATEGVGLGAAGEVVGVIVEEGVVGVAGGETTEGVGLGVADVVTEGEGEGEGVTTGVGEETTTGVGLGVGGAATGIWVWIGLGGVEIIGSCCWVAVIGEGVTIVEVLIEGDGVTFAARVGDEVEMVAEGTAFGDSFTVGEGVETGEGFSAVVEETEEMIGWDEMGVLIAGCDWMGWVEGVWVGGVVNLVSTTGVSFGVIDSVMGLGAS